MAALQPIGGRVGDRLGPRRVLLVALVGFALASGLAPLARDLPALIAFRILQAVCACAITPNAMGLLAPAVPLLGRVDAAEREPDRAVVDDLQGTGRDER